MRRMVALDQGIGSNSLVGATILSTLGRGLLENDDKIVGIVFQIDHRDARQVRWVDILTKR